MEMEKTGYCLGSCCKLSKRVLLLIESLVFDGLRINFGFSFNAFLVGGLTELWWSLVTHRSIDLIAYLGLGCFCNEKIRREKEAGLILIGFNYGMDRI